MPSAKKKTSLNLPKMQMTPLLVIFTIILAFFTGYLFFKVQSLQQAKPGLLPEDEQAIPPVNLDKLPPVTDEDHIRGSKDAEIVLVEYSDLECPFCKTFHPTVQQIVEEYDGKVAWVYRHYPLSFHANAQKQAEASECAAELGGNDAFWQFVDAVFERTESNGTGFALSDLGPLAAELGLDQQAFQQCLDSGKYEKRVKDDMAGGAETGITGTPGTIIVTKDGKKDLINGAISFEDAKTQIDSLLQ